VGPSKPQLRLTKGQREQVEDLYRQEAGSLHKYACAHGHVSEAWDLVQTTFQAAIRTWPTVGEFGPDERRMWLRRVLMNKAIDHLRKQKMIGLTDDLSDQQCRSADPGERAELAIALAGCWEEIERMPPMRRTVASLFWSRSWTTEHIAEHLGVAQSTVRGHLWEARKRLRAAVGHLVYFIDDEEGQEPAP
jgi:RNA polymerase sigma-70 factor, ECF subfamily